jgi:hypothetical protein
MLLIFSGKALFLSESKSQVRKKKSGIALSMLYANE